MGGDLFHRKMYMMNDRPLDVTPYVADLLDADIPVLVYNGDRDMTTCATGSELLLNAMDWKGKDEWLDATRGVWMVENVKGGEGGWAKELLGLTFVVVYNSGHSKYTMCHFLPCCMVPIVLCSFSEVVPVPHHVSFFYVILWPTF
jgi:hypothetical protein